jgi:hypothetical protein
VQETQETQEAQEAQEAQETLKKHIFNATISLQGSKYGGLLLSHK